MENFLENLRQKSASTKFFIAFLVTAAVVIPVVLIWGFSMKNDLAGTYEYESEERSADASKKDNGALLSVGKAVGGVASDIWDFLSASLTQPYPEQNSTFSNEPAGVLIKEVPAAEPALVETASGDVSASTSSSSSTNLP